jgi:hypothetical protein
VKHEYDTWAKEKTILKTCNQATKEFVTNRQPPQEVVAGGEIVFSYDVKFVVSTPGRSALLLICSFCSLRISYYSTCAH